jgi:hypothetical protein
VLNPSTGMSNSRMKKITDEKESGREKIVTCAEMLRGAIANTAKTRGHGETPRNVARSCVEWFG